jgi:hypothetical protein
VLTQGRLWRTARLSVTVNVVGAISGPVIGIVLLFLSDLPLAGINGISSLSSSWRSRSWGWR